MDRDTPKSKKPMSKDEVAYFVDLIQNYSILISKETNAATNKLKEDAWVSLTAAFNAKCGSIPKNKDQLKLKWDNLKKGARKRTQQIRMNHLKTGGGKADFIPPDEILDKVANMLGATCTGFMVSFGGDGIADDSNMLELEVAVDEELPEHLDAASVQLPDFENTPKTAKKRIFTAVEDDTSVCNLGAKYLYGMPTMAKPLQNNAKRRKLKMENDGRLERNLAIANYYNKKTEKLDLEIKLLKSQLNKENNDS